MENLKGGKGKIKTEKEEWRKQEENYKLSTSSLMIKRLRDAVILYETSKLYSYLHAA